RPCNGNGNGGVTGPHLARLSASAATDASGPVSAASSSAWTSPRLSGGHQHHPHGAAKSGPTMTATTTTATTAAAAAATPPRARPSARTHVPSLAAQGFSHPLNPQRLQAQRSAAAAAQHHHQQGHLQLNAGARSPAQYSLSHRPSPLQPPVGGGGRDRPANPDHVSVVSGSTFLDDLDAPIRPLEHADAFRDECLSWVSGTRPSLSVVDNAGGPHQRDGAREGEQDDRRERERDETG
ncbi:hypothetical protein KEM52_004596, partial [Ascosphaera acerosa]